MLPSQIEELAIKAIVGESKDSYTTIQLALIDLLTDFGMDLLEAEYQRLNGVKGI